MIDIRTLHIGSHVSVDGKYVRICGITKRKVGYHATEKPCEHLQYARLNEVKPILLTIELLTELGFEYRDETYWDSWYYDSFIIERKKHSSYFNCDGYIPLKYLHEMKNMYYMIYGKEFKTE